MGHLTSSSQVLCFSSVIHPEVIMIRPLIVVGALVLLAVIAEAAITYKDDYKKDGHYKDDSYKKDDHYKQDSYKKDDHYKDDHYKDDYKEDSYKKDHHYKKYDHGYKKKHITYAKSYKHEPEYQEYE